jgi:hypothetical protein
MRRWIGLFAILAATAVAMVVVISQINHQRYKPVMDAERDYDAVVLGMNYDDLPSLDRHKFAHVFQGGTKGPWYGADVMTVVYHGYIPGPEPSVPVRCVVVALDKNNRVLAKAISEYGTPPYLADPATFTPEPPP